jgi:hypothetical protein
LLLDFFRLLLFFLLLDFFEVDFFRVDFLPVDFFRLLDFFRGTFAPFSRASDRPIAMACSRLFTLG